MFGNDGNDRLSGGTGRDFLIGGLGRDMFLFTDSDQSVGANADVIATGIATAAFQGAGAAKGDMINLHAIDANQTIAGDQDFVFGGAAIGQVRVINKGSDSVVQCNMDADADFELTITIQDGGVLAAAYTAADFVL